VGLRSQEYCILNKKYPKEKYNELIMEISGLVSYLDKWGIEFYKILKGKTFEETAVSYNTIVAHLFSEYKKKVGIMGIGSNLHTAGLFPNSEADHSPHYVVYETVSNEFPKRISLSLKALGEFDNFIILVFMVVPLKTNRLCRLFW